MTTSAWTEDRVGRLKTLWREGRTADQISRELQNGITRSAVLGKVFRLGLSASRARLSVKSAKSAQSAQAPRPPKRSAQSRRDRSGEHIARPPHIDAAPEGRTTILSVRRFECRWPYGDPGEPSFSLCGQRVARGAYCAVHAERGYRAPPGGPNALMTLARLR